MGWETSPTTAVSPASNSLSLLCGKRSECSPALSPESPRGYKLADRSVQNVADMAPSASFVSVKAPQRLLPK